MIRSLLNKELQQHWPWFLIIALLTVGVAVLASIGANAAGTGAGALTGVGSGLLWLMPISAGILGQLLIATEFQLKSQLFLEGLPLSRWRMITLKIILGLLVSTVTTVACIVVGWVMTKGTEVMTPRFIGILLSSACSWAAFITMVLFVISFLGRYRVAIILVILIMLLVLSTGSVVPVGKFPPFALMNERRFGLEREVFPIEDLKWTNMYTLGLIVVAYILGLAKEGSIASMLGEKMSYREKMFIGGGMVIIALTLMTVLDQPKPEPFDIPGAVAEEWDGVEVYVSPEEQGKPVDLEIAIGSRLARRLAKQRDWLGIPKEEFPRIYVVEKSDIEDEERIDWENVAERGVVLMSAGLRQEEFSEDRLLAWTLSNVLNEISMDRVGHEDRWWIICGLEGLSELTEATVETRQKREQMAVAAIKKNKGFSEKNLMDWHKFQDDVEWRSADAVAWMGMRLLAEKKGLDVVQKFAQQSVTKTCDRADFRAVWWDYTNSVRSTFKQVTGMSLAEFSEDWRKYILTFDESEAVIEGQEEKP